VVCTIHYFGVFTLGLVAFFDWIAHRAAPARRGTALLLVSLGLVALLACVPLYLRQRGSLTVATWIDSASPQAVAEFAISIFRPVYLGLVPLAWLGSLATPVASTPGGRPTGADATGLAGLASLVLLPVVLVVFSYVVQPVLVDRYALPALA